MGTFRKTLLYLKRNGPLKTLRMSAQRLMEQQRERGYEDRRRSEAVSLIQLKAQEEHSQLLGEHCFSLIIPAYETEEDHLRVLLDSLIVQSYSRFEIIIADGSKGAGVSQVCAEYDDERIVYIKLKTNGGISANTNAALESAGGDVVVFVDHDDFLEPDALYHLALAFEDGARMAYTDEDKYEETEDRAGRYFCPNKKPDFDYDLLLSNNYISHLTAIETELVRSVGGFRSRYDGAQDYDLFLRCAHAILEKDGFFRGETTDVNQYIRHIPRVLYHWRVHGGSTAENPDAKTYAYEAGRMALKSYMNSRGITCEVEHTEHLGFYSIVYGDRVDMEELHFAVPSSLKPLDPDFVRFTLGIFKRPEVRAVVYRVLDRKGRVEDSVCKGVKWWDSGLMHRNAMPRDLAKPEGRVYCIRKEARGSLFVYLPGIMFKRK